MRTVRSVVLNVAIVVGFLAVLYLTQRWADFVSSVLPGWVSVFASAVSGEGPAAVPFAVLWAAEVALCFLAVMAVGPISKARELAWYFQGGSAFPIRLVVLAFWGLVAAWSAFNYVTVMLGFLSVPFFQRSLATTTCGLILWDLLPRSPILEFFPGTTSHGLIGTATLLASSVLTFLVARATAFANVRIAGSEGTLATRGWRIVGRDVAGALGVLGILLASMIILGVGASLVIGLSGDPNLFDFRIPWAC